MIVRKIKGTELKRTAELFALAFEFGSAEERTAEEVFAQISAKPQSREDFYWQERWAAFEDDDRTMMSFFIAKPMPVHFDGQRVTMTGIGGVATLPPYRRRGGIRACFAAALPEMYAKGVAFSYLYPFSTAYYRKFGYEMGVERIRYEILLSAIPAFSVRGSCYLCEPANPLGGDAVLADIQMIYREWQNRYNLMVVNEDFEFAWVAQCNPVKDQVFTFVYRDGDGCPKAFATFQSSGTPGERDLVCSQFFFRDLAGLQGLLLLAKSYASDHRALIFYLPNDLGIAPLLPEWAFGSLKREIEPGGMVRVIDAAGVLRMARYRGSGSLVIEITDEYIPQNSGFFRVTFADGRATEVCQIEETAKADSNTASRIATQIASEATPNTTSKLLPEISVGSAKSIQLKNSPVLSAGISADIAVGIGDFSRLITGAFQPNMLPFLPSVRIYGEPAAIEKVFYPKPCYIAEYF